MSLRQLYISIIFFGLVIFSLFITVYEVQAVACAGTCGGSFTCDSGLSCKPTDNKCGITYSSCVGATCVLDNLWDIAVPCTQADLCTPAGTTRTADWGVFGVCSVACGTGTHTRTCNCGSENNCIAPQCTDALATGDCGEVDTQACCIDQLPQTKPIVTSVGNINCGKSASLPVVWTFGDTGSDCGLSWGYTCGGNTDTFTIKVDGSPNTTGIAPAARTATISTSVAVSHQIQVCAENGFGENCSAATTVTIDNTAPPIPVPTIQITPDPACLGKSNVTYSWNAVSDIGCAGMDVNPIPTNAPYWSQASTNNLFPSSDFPVNGWGNYITQTTNTSYIPGRTLYAHVQSRDALDNQSGWSGTDTVVIPTPIPYPTIHIAGTFTEDINGSCNPGITLDASALTFAPSTNPNIGVTTDDCINTTSTTYSCNITINNITGLCVSPDTTLTLNASYPGYTNVGWRIGNVCGGVGEDARSLTKGENQLNWPLFFTFDGGNGWFKLSQTSFNSRSESGRQNYIPNTIFLFDASGDDSIANKYMMIGSAGNIVQDGRVVVGPASTKYSENNWYTDEYQHANDITYLQYIDYIKARKDFKTITNVDLSEITTDGVYSISSPVTLSAGQFDGKKVVLVVLGKATFDADFIPPNSGSVAILASSIEIKSTVKEIDAILIGQTVLTILSTGGDSASAIGLKIKGNLIDESVLQIDRTQTDARKPSLFVVFDPKIYLDVLPYLSTSTYDWRQLQ